MSPRVNAVIIHGAMVLGVVLFWIVAWYLGRSGAPPATALPDRHVLYVAMFVLSAGLFGAALFAASRFTPAGPGTPADDWWRVNLPRAIIVWALVETPTLIGLIVYLITRDFRVLLAPFIGMLLFLMFRPARLTGVRR